MNAYLTSVSLVCVTSFLYSLNICSQPSGRGFSLQYIQRAWMFGVKNVIRWLHQDSSFLKAVREAYPPNIHDLEDIFSSSYFQSIDALTGHTWSTRQDPLAVGFYILGTFWAI